MSFSGANIPKETCFHLYTLGPNVDSILKCDCSEESVSYAPYLHKNTVLHSKIPHDALVGLRKADLTGIRVSILLGPVVQSIVSLTSLLRGQLVKCFMIL